MSKILSLVIGYALSSFVLKLFTTLGIGFFTYKTISSLVDSGLGYVSTFMYQLPASILELLALSGLDQALSIIGSALITAATIKSAQVFVGTIT